MKKHFVIDVNIDTDREGFAGSNVRYDTDEKGNRTVDLKSRMRVEITHEPIEMGFDVLTVTAHELGHVLAQVFELPAAKAGHTREADMQYNIARIIGLKSPEFIKREEKEAWDVAERLGVPIDRLSREHSLKSYEDGYPTPVSAEERARGKGAEAEGY